MHPLSSAMACLLALERASSLLTPRPLRPDPSRRSGRVPLRPWSVRDVTVRTARGPAAKFLDSRTVADYLDKQLRDYASGARSNEVMQNFAKPLSEADCAAVAAYFASLTVPYSAPNPGPLTPKWRGAINWRIKDRNQNAYRRVIIVTVLTGAACPIRRLT